MSFPYLQRSVERLLSSVTPTIGSVLDRAISGADITLEEASLLFDADGSDLLAMTAAADYLRAQT
ncbi:MAG TPA: hypothetical protein VNY32_08975, partial [Candidatus Acidoferrales bacterium]|nr:hypothetical protein [Candidatus Acidoferrales bacterium]